MEFVFKHFIITKELERIVENIRWKIRKSNQHLFLKFRMGVVNTLMVGILISFGNINAKNASNKNKVFTRSGKTCCSLYREINYRIEIVRKLFERIF